MFNFDIEEVLFIADIEVNGISFFSIFTILVKFLGNLGVIN